MKILILSHSLEYGGTETQIINLVNHVKARAQVTLALYYKTPITRTRAEALSGVNIVYLSSGTKRRNSISLMWRLFLLIRQQRSDVMLSYLMGTNLANIIVGSLGGVRKIVCGLRIVPVDQQHFSLRDRLMDLMQIRLAQYADLFVANSNESLRQYRDRGLPVRNSLVIPNGIDIARFKRNNDLRARTRAKLEIDDSIFLIGTIARLVPWKGYASLLQAISKAVSLDPSFRFMIVGGGDFEYAQSLRTIQADLGIEEGIIRWMGRRDDTVELLNACDLFTLASSSGEGLSNALLEAMAIGVPVVGTDVGDTKLVIGEDGCVVEPDNPDRLSDAWMMARSHWEETQQRARRATRRIREDFEAEQRLEEFFQVISCRRLS